MEVLSQTWSEAYPGELSFREGLWVWQFPLPEINSDVDSQVALSSVLAGRRLTPRLCVVRTVFFKKPASQKPGVLAQNGGPCAALEESGDLRDRGGLAEPELGSRRTRDLPLSLVPWSPYLKPSTRTATVIL